MPRTPLVVWLSVSPPRPTASRAYAKGLRPCGADVRNPDKKQLNVMIAVIVQLDELATKHNLKRLQAITRLIAGELEAQGYT
jgi:hypothetical protein